MGSSQSCGIGVLNLSNWEEINIGLSMGKTHYYENGVKKGCIFYRWPGAVWHTVYVHPRKEFGPNDISYLTGCKEMNDMISMKNCYSGGRGTWLIVTGGAYTDEEGKFWPRDIEFKISSQEEVFKKGTFSPCSHDAFHTKEGLQCTENCSHCKTRV